MFKKLLALVRFKDGTAHIAEYKLQNELSFGKVEMRQWIREQSNRPIKSITFLKAQGRRSWSLRETRAHRGKANKVVEVEIRCED